MNIFEQASRLALRFNSPKGALTVEDLWKLPLTSKVGAASLDGIAMALAAELKSAAAVTSFVNPVESRNIGLQLQFDIAKYIIDVRVAENAAEADAAKKRETKQRILQLIAEKQDDSLKGKTIEELQALAATL